ncbi:MAG: chemotaxis protein CheW [Syntrophomonadaceae bacterium]|jgi:purine-binding chemotaxis protein CheW
MEERLNTYFQGPNSQGEEIQIVAFKLGEEEYAVDILNVQEIIRLLNITRVPKANNYIEGVINLRGNIIPIINLHKKFNLKSLNKEESKRIIVFQFEDVKVGIIVDEVSEVLRLSQNDIEETSKVYSSIDTQGVKGIAKVNNRLLTILNLSEILIL